MTFTPRGTIGAADGSGRGEHRAADAPEHVVACRRISVVFGEEAGVLRVERRKRDRTVAREQIAAHRRAEQLGDLAAARRRRRRGSARARRRSPETRALARDRRRASPHRDRVQRRVGLRSRPRQNLGARDPLFPEVLRDGDEGRSARRHAREQERAAQHFGDGRRRSARPRSTACSRAAAAPGSALRETRSGRAPASTARPR